MRTFPLASIVTLLRYSPTKQFSTLLSIPVLTTSSKYAEDLGLELISDTQALEYSDLILRRSDKGILELAWGGASVHRETPFYIDFSSQDMRRRGSTASSELVVKALGKTPNRDSITDVATLVWDLTSGLGRDSFLIASAGYRVRMFERNEVLHALLADGIQRLSVTNPNLSSRMILNPLSDSTRLLLEGSTSLENQPIAVYLDPMYPAGAVGKRSNVKKETQMLRRLVGEIEVSVRFHLNDYCSLA